VSDLKQPKYLLSSGWISKSWDSRTRETPYTNKSKGTLVKQYHG
jgi:hypothetical protein